MSITTLTADNFDTEALNSDKTVLIDFWASWCGPCRMLSPIVDEIAEEMPQIKVCKINIDEEQSLAQKFSIMSIPTLVVLKDGKAVSTAVGVRPKDDILNMLK